MTMAATRGLLCAALLVALAGASGARAVESERLAEGLSAYVEDNVRWEHWAFFDPAPPGGEPNYDFGANRLRVGVRYQRPHFALHAAVQYPQLFGLPDDAIGTPGGALGTGAGYFDHSGERAPEAMQLKYLSAEARDLFGAPLDVMVGRFSYSSGVGPDSGLPKLETVKRARVAERLIGEFGFSHFQRSFDGVRVRWHPTAGELDLAVFRPTEGGFEDGGTRSIDDIDVAAVAYTPKLGLLIPGVELQAFYYFYDDERQVPARVDNSGLPAPARQDLSLHTLGGHLLAAWALGPGEFELLAWGAYQAGRWFGQDQRAGAGALEAGYQLAQLPWMPWLRVGFFRSSGDRDPSDGTHGTFFQMLPTARLYSLTTSNNLMNSTDTFIELRLQPTEKLGVQVDVRDLRLSSADDLWYSGAGATQDEGRIVGYSGRASGDHHRLGTAIELTVRARLTDFLAAHVFYGHIFGGNVVRTTFADRHELDFFFLEATFTREWKGRSTRPPNAVRAPVSVPSHRGREKGGESPWPRRSSF
jgi:hypothetical protein